MSCAVHSGAGTVGYAATDRLPELIATMVNVDSGHGALVPDVGLKTFRRRAVPQPVFAGWLRDGLRTWQPPRQRPVP